MQVVTKHVKISTDVLTEMPSCFDNTSSLQRAACVKLLNDVITLFAACRSVALVLRSISNSWRSSSPIVYNVYRNAVDATMIKANYDEARDVDLIS